MANQRWFQKATVQGAMVAGVFAIVAAVTGAVIGLSGRSPGNTETPKAISLPPSSPAPADKKPTLGFDRQYSPESIQSRMSLRGPLRVLSAAESALPVQKIPPRTFGFAHSLLFRNSNFEVDRVPNGRLSFEVHKVETDETYVIAFVNADSRRMIELNNQHVGSATLYSDFWADAPYAVRIALGACKGDYRIVTLDDGSKLVAVDCNPMESK